MGLSCGDPRCRQSAPPAWDTTSVRSVASPTRIASELIPRLDAREDRDTSPISPRTSDCGIDASDRPRGAKREAPRTFIPHRQPAPSPAAVAERSRHAPAAYAWQRTQSTTWTLSNAGRLLHQASYARTRAAVRAGDEPLDRVSPRAGARTGCLECPARFHTRASPRGRRTSTAADSS